LVGIEEWLNFKNHPSIATELVKFLAINTSFEAIEKLTAKTTLLDLEMAEMKKKVNEAIKAATLAANKKSDECKHLTDLLAKRVKTLEEKR
jgi:SOS response regulatory protein OraA/RecX